MASFVDDGRAINQDGGAGGPATSARLPALLTMLDEPVLAWRIDGPIEFWNAGAERLYGFSADEALGNVSHTLLQTKFPLDLSAILAQLESTRSWAGELRQVCKQGREIIVDSRMQLLGDGTVLEVNRDVTARKEIEAALHESRADPAMAGVDRRIEQRRDCQQKP